MKKKHIRIKATSTHDYDFGIKLIVDGQTLVRHLEADLVLGIRKLLILMGVSPDNFEITDER